MQAAISPTFFNPKPILACLLILALIAAAIAVSAHAIERHGEEAVIASQCRDHPNAVLFFNPATGRTAYVCLTEHGFGVAIVDRLDQMVTAYLKNKQHTLNQVSRYLQNTGYGLLP